ncbi:transmembrane protein 214-B-like [Oscarella lobularis]|uniref:transmembrane protein 214-B-like n=1 Tax=Oscarella lobularis TaxID=121494 RepID=UPI0033142FF7
MKSHVKDTRTLLSLLWAVGQTSDDDPRPTLKVWLLSVLSLFDTKGISEEAKSYIVEHLKKLIKLAEKSQKKCHDLVDPKDFIVLQKFALDENPNQFRDIYFRLKHLLFDSLPSKRYRNYFTSLLVSVREAKGNHREEILNCLVRCLTEDDHCYNLWTSLHASKNEQTRVLLHYVFDNWCDLRGKLPRQPFKFAVDYFLENELSETWLDEDEDVCLFFHRELAKRRYEARSFGWTRIAFVLSLILLAVLISLDIFYLSPSFEDSTSYAVLSTLLSWQLHLLEKAAPTLRLVFARVSFYWDKWSLPIWKAMKKFGLYLEPAWSWLSKKGADLSLMLYDNVGKWTS